MVAGTPPSRAQLYDWECREVVGRGEQDVGFWRRVVAGAPPGLVLELACGTGRVTVPLAEDGVEIVGLDRDPAMLAGARERRGGGRWPWWVAADMRRFAFSHRFAAVIVPYNSFQLLVRPSDAQACLRRMRGHLGPGGIVGLECTDFQLWSVNTDVEHEPIHSGELGGQPLSLSGSLSHDLAERTSRYRRRFIGRGWTAIDEVVIRSYRPDEIAALLSGAGLRPVQWWEDGAVTRVTASVD